jgi:hypothetical protein
MINYHNQTPGLPLCKHWEQRQRTNGSGGSSRHIDISSVSSASSSTNSTIGCIDLGGGERIDLTGASDGDFQQNETQDAEDQRLQQQKEHTEEQQRTNDRRRKQHNKDKAKWALEDVAREKQRVAKLEFERVYSSTTRDRIRRGSSNSSETEEEKEEEQPVGPVDEENAEEEETEDEEKPIGPPRKKRKYK